MIGLVKLLGLKGRTVGSSLGTLSHGSNLCQATAPDQLHAQIDHGKCIDISCPITLKQESVIEYNPYKICQIDWRRTYAKKKTLSYLRVFSYCLHINYFAGYSTSYHGYIINKLLLQERRKCNFPPLLRTDRPTDPLTDRPGYWEVTLPKSPRMRIGRLLGQD